MTGVLVIDKPAGPTSHDVVARVRRAIGERRIGHTGTLDPLATGVLPLVVGRATRLATFLSGEDKEYVAAVRLGSATDTYDAAGTPFVHERARSGASVTRGEVEAALAAFRGTYEQTPPAFSAKKVGGIASYRRARRSEQVTLAPVRVSVHELRLERFEPGLATLRITCSAGFYVRALAHELGERLGCGAHLAALRRTRAGSFSEADAAPLETVEAEGPLAAARLVQGDRLLPHLPAVVLTERGIRRASHGNPLSSGDWQEGQSPFSAGRGDSPPFRLLDGRGGLLGIAELGADGLLRPAVVLV